MLSLLGVMLATSIVQPIQSFQKIVGSFNAIVLGITPFKCFKSFCIDTENNANVLMSGRIFLDPYNQRKSQTEHWASSLSI